MGQIRKKARNTILDINSAPAFQHVTPCYKTEQWAYWRSNMGNAVFCSYVDRKILFLFCYNVALQYRWSPPLSKTAQYTSCLLKSWLIQLLLSTTDPVHPEKNRSVPKSHCIISLSREGSDTFLSTQLANFSKTCGNITVCDFHPSYKHGYNWSKISKATGEYIRKEWEKTRKKHKSHFLRKWVLQKGNSLQLLIEEHFLVAYWAKEISRFLQNIFLSFYNFTQRFQIKLWGTKVWENYHMKQDRLFLQMYLEAFGSLVKTQAFNISLARIIWKITYLLF